MISSDFKFFFFFFGGGYLRIFKEKKSFISIFEMVFGSPAVFGLVLVLKEVLVAMFRGFLDVRPATSRYLCPPKKNLGHQLFVLWCNMLQPYLTIGYRFLRFSMFFFLVVCTCFELSLGFVLFFCGFRVSGYTGYLVFCCPIVLMVLKAQLFLGLVLGVKEVLVAIFRGFLDVRPATFRYLCPPQKSPWAPEFYGTICYNHLLPGIGFCGFFLFLLVFLF